MPRWVERSRPLTGDERHQLELCRTVGRELMTGDPPTMVPLLLMFGTDRVHPEHVIALPDAEVAPRTPTAQHLKERLPRTWALLRVGEHDGQQGLLVDLGDRQTAFVVLLIGDEEPLLIDQLVSPLRIDPTDAELDAIDDVVARARDLPPGTVLTIDDATGRETRFEPRPDTRSLGHLMDEVQHNLMESATHFRLCGVGERGEVLAGVTAAGRTSTFTVRGGEKVLLHAPSLGED